LESVVVPAELVLCRRALPALSKRRPANPQSLQPQRYSAPFRHIAVTRRARSVSLVAVSVLPKALWIVLQSSSINRVRPCNQANGEPIQMQESRYSPSITRLHPSIQLNPFQSNTGEPSQRMKSGEPPSIGRCPQSIQVNAFQSNTGEPSQRMKSGEPPSIKRFLAASSGPPRSIGSARAIKQMVSQSKCKKAGTRPQSQGCTFQSR
jgi:hypothetical protein